jgi:hypothetical protein
MGYLTANGVRLAAGCTAGGAPGARTRAPHRCRR